MRPSLPESTSFGQAKELCRTSFSAAMYPVAEKHSRLSNRGVLRASSHW
jgi:hypothetical protein